MISWYHAPLWWCIFGWYMYWLIYLFFFRFDIRCDWSNVVHDVSKHVHIETYFRVVAWEFFARCNCKDVWLRFIRFQAGNAGFHSFYSGELFSATQRTHTHHIKSVFRYFEQVNGNKHVHSGAAMRLPAPAPSGAFVARADLFFGRKTKWSEMYIHWNCQSSALVGLTQ